MNFEIIKSYLPEMVTQLLGFLIVFLILKKFAFASILGIIDERRRKIEEEFKSIEGQKKGLEELEKEYRLRLEKIEEEARVKIQNASNTAAALARDIQEKARQDAQKMVERGKADIEQELAKARLSLRNEIVEISGLMTEKIMREKLDSGEHGRMVDKFLKELEKVN